MQEVRLNEPSFKSDLFLARVGSNYLLRVLANLTAAGLSGDQIARLQCPIGIPELHGRAPEVIAVSVAAQVLQVLQDDED